MIAVLITGIICMTIVVIVLLALIFNPNRIRDEVHEEYNEDVSYQPGRDDTYNGPGAHG